MVPQTEGHGVIMLRNEASPGIFLAIDKKGSVYGGGKKEKYCHLKVMIHQDTYCSFSSMITETYYVNFNEMGQPGTTKHLDDDAKFLIRMDVSTAESDSTLVHLTNF